MTAKLFRGPDNVALRFFERPVRNNFQSEAKGHAVFDTVVFAEVMTPGQNESVPEFEIQRTYVDTEGKPQTKKSKHYARYKEAADAYLSGREGDTEGGMPIASWGLIDAGTAETFKSQNVYTVEQLAAVSDSDIQKLGMGAVRLREQAKQFLVTRQFGVPAAQMTSKVQEMEMEVNRLKAENDDLRTQLAAAKATVEPTPAPTPAPEATPADGATETPADPFAALAGGDGEQVI